MSLFLLSLGLISFILYFYGIGLRYLGFLPIIFLASFISYHGMANTIRMKSSEILGRYSLYVARIIILVGFVGVLNFFGMELIKISLTLVWVNLFLWIWSYLVDYKDGKSVFTLGYYLSLIFLLMIGAVFSDSKWFFLIFKYLWIFNLAIIAFMTFIVGLFKEVEKYMLYKTFILWIGAIILVIIDQVSNIYIALAMSTVFLTAIFSRIFKILQHRPIPKDFSPTLLGKKANISIRRILAGERITQPKKYFNSATAGQIYEFTSNMPALSKQALEFINIILMATVIINYLLHRQGFTTLNQFLYRIIIAFFIGNVLILKKINYNSIFQNLAVFLVINFAIYLSLFSYFDGNFSSIALRWIIRNIASAIFIFYAPRKLSHIFDSVDYIYRTIATIMASIVNVILLIKTPLAWELIFFLALLYLGVQWMLLFYAVKYIMKLDTTKELIINK